MKTKVISALAAMFVASSLFGTDLSKNTNEELYKMVATSDAKMLSEVGLEIHKRAGKLHKEGDDVLDGFRDEMKKKMSGLSDEKREEFMREFRAAMDAKIDVLSVKEAKQMGFFMGHDGKGGKSGGCAMKDKNFKHEKHSDKKW